MIGFQKIIRQIVSFQRRTFYLITNDLRLLRNDFISRSPSNTSVNNNSNKIALVLFPIRRFSLQSESDYHSVADKFLESLQDYLSILEEKLDDIDIGSASGVLNVNLGKIGYWVINKQTPNRQIWWSSPISGPLRFEYDSKDKDWKSTKNGKSLLQLMQQEIKDLSSIDILEKH